MKNIQSDLTINKKTTMVLDIPFCKWPMFQTTEWISTQLHTQANRLTQVVTANPEIVMTAQNNAQLRLALHEADLITPDGTGIVWAANYLGDPVAERVAGYDLLHELCKMSEERPFSVYLLGAKEETNQKAADKLTEMYPNLHIVGRRNGYFNVEEEQDIINEINELRPNLLLVALGFPKQEIWIHQHKHKLKVNVAIGVGGSLDVLAGTVKRAPEIWQKLRIEWLYRLLQEPSRFRRQLVLPKFVLAVIRYKKQLQKL